MTEAGWRAAVDAGVRTVLDLRNDDEVPAHPPYARYGIDRVRVALDGVEDVEFWRYLDEAGLNGTPLYYRPFLERKPERCAQAVTAVARARPGAVVYHCGAGRDRTGLLTLLLLTLLLLALAGVEPEAVAADHDLGAEPLRALFARSGRADEGPAVERLLAARGTTVAEAILSTLDGFDAEAYLLAAGVSAADLAAVRARLLG